MNRATSAVGGSADMPLNGRTPRCLPLPRNGERARARLGLARGPLARMLRPAVVLLLLALTVGQAAAGPDRPLELRYRFSWAGVPIAGVFW